MLRTLLFQVLAYTALVLASWTPQIIRQVYEFPKPTLVGLENIAIRPNGHILLSSSSAAHLYSLNPFADTPVPELIYEFPMANGSFGIANTHHDAFTVIIGNYTDQMKGLRGSFEVWQVEFSRGLEVRRISTIPEAEALNGMATASTTTADVVFIADSVLGCIWSLDISSGSYRKEACSAQFLPGASSPIGINGVHVHGQNLYFTNSAKRIFGRIPISKDGLGLVSSQVEILAEAPTGHLFDDFAIDQRGSAFVATIPDSVVEIDACGDVRNMTAGSSFRTVYPTSAALGRGRRACSLYVVTHGDISEGGVTNGQILEMNVCR